MGAFYGFSSPIGDLFILIIYRWYHFRDDGRFSSPTGDLFILILSYFFVAVGAAMFSSPTGDLFILMHGGNEMLVFLVKVLVTYRGLIYFNQQKQFHHS